MTWLRWLPSAALLIGGLAAAGLIASTSDVTWRSVWIGLAATCLSTGAVDATGLLERRRALRPVRQLVGRRIGKFQQLVLELTRALLGNVKADENDSWITSLRDIPDAALDLSQPASVHPPRSKAVYVQQLVSEIADLRLELASYASAGVLADQIEALDTLADASLTLNVLRFASVVGPGFTSRKQFSDDLAKLLDEMRPHVSAARKAAGSTWRYGNDLA